ncbi:GAF domain-containing serine/threonine-protein kinase [Frondihabitans sp. PAMC 28766]|uniref:protein kinase domain-containing protein n=1 Tax=Frondihabitans sp. PAMC 28766 TaxID=1795630 RepID=UPI000A405626|nr:GAF domain-containing serine/threonine-protein kinase [Frondihabitans sp. PAMC 28766]
MGRTLSGRYRLEEPVGRGGMSTVFRAVDEQLGRQVAVKVFHANTVDPARQEAELGVLASLEHHSIVTLLDAGVDGPDRYLVMPLITGQNLQDRFAGEPISARHIAEIGYDMAEALDYIQQHGVVHRDIKPSNILLVDYGAESPRARARLTDFGIALSDDVERLTAEGVTTGTAAYLSPEQAMGGTVGPASDVYSLGLVLLQCFTHHLEFGGSLVESAVARLSRDPVVPAELTDQWRELLTLMTHRDPAARPVGVELVTLLRQAVIAESSRHRDSHEVFVPSSGRSAAESPATSPLLDTVPAQSLDRVTAMAARLFSAPMSVISVVDDDRTWFRSHLRPGLSAFAERFALAPVMGGHSEAVVIEDGRIDSRVKNDPLVTGPLGLRFYVGVPIVRHDGRAMGTLSVIDFVAGHASPDDLANLEDLAALVAGQLELRQETLRVTTGNLARPSAERTAR